MQKFPRVHGHGRTLLQGKVTLGLTVHTAENNL